MEDAVQDILFRGFNAIQSYKPGVSFNAWIYKIAYNHCLNLLRRRQMQMKLSWLFKGETLTESPEDLVVKQVFSEPMAAALSQLSPFERSLVILHIFQDKTFSEIGEIMDKSPEAVRKKLSRIKTQLKQVLEQWKGDEEWHVQPAWMKMKI